MPADERPAPSFARDDPASRLSSLYASFTSTYLTLTSIIQGVALAYLVVVVDDEFDSLRPATWILVVAMFLAIVAAWHEYMTAVSVLEWIPRTRDSLIPFALGGAELAAIGSLSRGDELELFFLAMSVTSVVTLVAFLNMYSSAAAEAERNRALLATLGSYKWLTLVFVGASGMLLLVFSAVEALADDSRALDIVLSTVTLTLVAAFLVRSSLHWRRVVDVLRESGRRRTPR